VVRRKGNLRTGEGGGCLLKGDGERVLHHFYLSEEKLLEKKKSTEGKKRVMS